MSTITTAPGLLSIDPIQGLVDYVLDIKPFHTKIFQVLFEYIYTDAVATTVVDTLNMYIDNNQTYITLATDPALINPGGIAAGAFWFDSATGTLYLRGNYLNPQFRVGTNILTLAGNYTGLFTPGFAFNISGTGTVDDGDYTVATAVFDGNNTIIATTPSAVNGTPGTALFVAPPINTGTFYWNGFNLYIVNGTNYTSIPNVIVQTSPPPYGALNAYWFNPSTGLLSSWNGTTYVPAVLSAGIMGYWIPFITQLAASPNPSANVDTSVTEFMETIAFDWSGNYSFAIVGQNLGNNQVSIAGNLTTALMIDDITQIDSTVSYITAIAYDPGSDTTVVTMNAVPPSISVLTLTVQDIDITYWFEWPVIGANPTPTAPSQSPLAAAQSSTNTLILSIDSSVVVPSITVSGNATTSVQVGALFQVTGSASNNGVYYAKYVQYEPIANTTTIGVAATTGVPAPTLTALAGGQIVPYRFVAEAQQGSYDQPYDAGAYDQSAGSIIYQGP